MVFNVWTIHPQFSSEGVKIPVTHLNIFLKLYLVVIKLILSDMNIHKHIRNTPGDRKQPFPAQPFEIKRQSSPSAMTAFTEPLLSDSDALTKRSTELKQAKTFQCNQHSSTGFSSCRMCFFFSAFNTVALAHLSILIYRKESASFKIFYNCFSEFVLKEDFSSVTEQGAHSFWMLDTHLKQQGPSITS